MNPRIRDLYLVSYIGGTSGSFIASLVWVWLTDDTPMGITEYGEADYSNFVNNYTIKNFDHFNGYKTNKPKDENLPYVIRAHGDVDVGWINEHYRNNIIFNIVHDSRNRNRIVANNIFKIIWRSYDKKQNSLFPTWEDLLRLSNITFKTANECTIDDNLTLINFFRDDLQGDLDQIGLLNCNPNDPNIINLSFWDIIYDKEKILNIISKGLNRPRTRKIVKMYDEYLAAQEEFINKVAPWIRDEEEKYLK